MWIVGYPESPATRHETWNEARDALVWSLDNLLLTEFRDFPRKSILKLIALLERCSEPQEVNYCAAGRYWWIEEKGEGK